MGSANWKLGDSLAKRAMRKPLANANKHIRGKEGKVKGNEKGKLDRKTGSD